MFETHRRCNSSASFLATCGALNLSVRETMTYFILIDEINGIFCGHAKEEACQQTAGITLLRQLTKSSEEGPLIISAW